MNRNLPSRLCRDVNSFSSYPHSTDLEKLGLATIPTPTKNRGSAVFPTRVSEVTLCRELCMPGEKPADSATAVKYTLISGTQITLYTVLQQDDKKKKSEAS